MTSESTQRKRWIHGLTRSSFLFIIGVILFVNEGVIRDGPVREPILIAAATLVGLPATLTEDFLRRKAEK